MDPICFQDSDCGTNGYVGSLFCFFGDLGQKWRTYKCNNPGTGSASCSDSDSNKVKQDCGDDGYVGSNYCYNNDVYRDFVDKGCSNDECFENTDKVLQQNCGTNGCSNGQCNQQIECNSNSECGTNSWIGNPFCSSGDVYQAYRTYTCNSPGTISSSCSNSDSNNKKQECGAEGCSNNQCNTGTVVCSSNAECGTNGYVGSVFCSDGDIYQAYRTYTSSNPGTISSSCSNSDSYQLKEDCGTNGCSSGVCNVGECPTSVCGGYCGSYSGFPNYRFYNLDGEGSYYPFCDSSCKYNYYEYCDYGCEDGECIELVCTKNSDCGTNGYVGSFFCLDNDIYQEYRTYTCSNPGTISSSCSSSDSNKKVSNCGELGCHEGGCRPGVVYFLEKGWNELIIYYEPENTEISNVLSSIGGKYDNVWAQVDGQWLSYSPTVLPLTSTLNYLEEGMTFQIEMNQAGVLTVISA